MTVTVPEPVEKAEIRPKSKGVMRTFSGNVITFTLHEPMNIGLEFNGKETSPLFIFANPIHTPPDASDPKAVFLAGGKIYNNYSWPDITGKTLYIEGGAVVKADRLTDTGNGFNNATILGSGIITQKKPTETQTLFGWGAPSRNFILNGPIFVSTHQGGDWTVVPFNMDNSLFSNIKVIGMYRDAFDLLSRRNTVIENSFFWCRDDAFVLKASQWTDPKPVYSITVRNCVAWNHGFNIGFETRAPYIEDITISDCDIVRYCSNTGNPLKSDPYDGIRNPVIMIMVADQAEVTNVKWENIRVEDPWTDDFFQFMVDQNYASTANKRGAINGVHVKNVTIIDTDSRLQDIYRSDIRGYDKAHLVKNVLIEGLVWEGKEKTSRTQLPVDQFKFNETIVVRTLTPRTAAPLQPTDLKLTQDGAIATLKWTTLSENEDGFIIERADLNGE